MADITVKHHNINTDNVFILCEWSRNVGEHMKKIMNICVMILCLVGCTNSSPKDTIVKLEDDGFQINLLEDLVPSRVSVMKNRNDPCIVFYFENDTLSYIQFAMDSEGIPELENVIVYNDKGEVNKEVSEAYKDFLKENNFSQTEMEDFAEYIYHKEYMNK